jgi:hypothetical protein
MKAEEFKEQLTYQAGLAWQAMTEPCLLISAMTVDVYFGKQKEPRTFMGIPILICDSLRLGFCIFFDEYKSIKVINNHNTKKEQ